MNALAVTLVHSCTSTTVSLARIGWSFRYGRVFFHAAPVGRLLRVESGSRGNEKSRYLLHPVETLSQGQMHEITAFRLSLSTATGVILHSPQMSASDFWYGRKI